ncbi:MAG TPA: hypothetical protein VKM72_16850 [Thermoanaerobaculia bacterium]|nr:hypothetical protein [Thermoanaerobaculia bacterium]
MTRRLCAVLALCLILPAVAAQAQTAPDASGFGPLATTSSEYKLPAAVDPDVTTELATELWARVYRPATLSGAPYPLLVFLHGNHATCGRYEGIGPGRFDTNIQYTFSGTCPAGYVVVPSHEGYAYLAERLASWGYVVVSINANRGVTAAPAVEGDRGLNLRRGRLVLKHLQTLSQWNTSGGAPASLGFDVRSTLDLSHVGLLGHSRGGEGVRAAYNLYRDAGSPWPARIGPVRFEGIFEIGPVDGQTSRVLNADGTAWNVLLPMCDGDVADLQGVRPFDRMMAIRSESPALPKSTFTVWGTNHNFYNTEWQLSDSPGCLGHQKLFGNLLGSADQRVTALASVLAFFRANVGADADPALGAVLNPQFEVPASLADVTRVDRGYTDSADASVTTTFDDFDRPTGINSAGMANTASHVTVTHGGIADHDRSQRVAQVAWSSAGDDTWFQSNWTAPGTGRNASGYKTLDFRVSRQCGDAACTHRGAQWVTDTSFSIRLVGANGELSAPIRLSDLLTLTGPVGGLVRYGFGASPHPILQTVRIPLSAFASSAIVSHLRGVRFTFDDTQGDQIFLGNIRLSKRTGATTLAAFSPVLAGDDSPVDDSSTTNDVNQVKSMRQVSVSGTTVVEIELKSNRALLPRGELLILRIGGQEFGLSRYPASGDTTTVTFTLTAQEFAQLQDGASITVQYGSGPNRPNWNFGKINKGQLK